MATDSSGNEFYRELDRSRHRPRWGCVIVILIAIVVVFLGAIYFIKRVAS